MKKEVIAHKNPKSPISEVFRTLRTNIQFMNVDKKMKVLLLTSTFPSEGKSWVAANLAVTFAQAGKKVVLIDSDMRKGRQYAIFGISPRPGLSNFLSSVEIDENGNMSEDLGNYIQTTEVENLYVMAAGNVPPNPSELLVSTPMIRLLDELKTMCDIIIIDGTPSELVTDSVILSRLADSTVIVTAHKLTKKDALERVVKNIKNVGGRIAGVVINKVPVSAKRYGDRYYYYGEDKILSGKKTKDKVDLNKLNFKFKDSVNSKRSNGEINQNQYHNKNIESKNDVAIENEKNNMKENIQSTVTENNAQNVEKVSLDKTNDILKQINEYLEKEKKKLQ